MRHLNTPTSQLLKKSDRKRADVPVGRKQNRRQSQQGREKKVESVSDAVGAICDNGSALEISCDEASTKTYFAYADGAPVGVLSVEGELTCKDFRKIKRFVNLLDAYNIPLVSVVDSDGFAARLKCEEKGVAKIAAEAYTAMALSENPKIAVIKNAIGGAYALLAAKEIGFNYTIAFSDATIAPLSSDQAVNFYDEKNCRTIRKKTRKN
ncbi:MAG: hypothetical protein L6V85_07015 [Clostridiales bacterium]|nr:MAG: hypothetical protein L6V85_07015 [Clostridiales bacterium]